VTLRGQFSMARDRKRSSRVTQEVLKCILLLGGLPRILFEPIEQLRTTGSAVGLTDLSRFVDRDEFLD